MTSYITVEDLGVLVAERTMIELSNDNYSANEIDREVVERINEKATEYVNGFLRGRYTLPFPVIPTMVKDLTEKVSRYLLYTRRPEGALPEAISIDYKDTQKTLEMIRDGLISIGYPETQAAVADDGEFQTVVRQSGSNSRGFSREVLNKY